MSITNELSTALGQRGNEANKAAAEKCRKKPALLKELVPLLNSKDKGLSADAAEVFTEVAVTHPELVAPYAEEFIPLLKNKNNRTRWESMHAIALVADLRADVVESILPDLDELVERDNSIIVRDYAIESVGNYAAVGKKTARKAYPHLKTMLYRWDGRHAGKVLTGLTHIAKHLPETHSELMKISAEFSDHPKQVIKKAAAKLMKELKKS